MNFHEERLNKTINESNFSTYRANAENENSFCLDFGWRKVKDCSILKLTGKDRNDLLNRLSASDLSQIETNDFRKVILTNEKGKLIDFFDYINFEDFSLIITSNFLSKKTKLWINKYTILEDIKIENNENTYTLYEFYGRKVYDAIKYSFDISDSSFEIANKIISTGDHIFYYYEKFEDKSLQICKALINVKLENEFLEKLKLSETLYEIKELTDNEYEALRINLLIPIPPNEINDEFNPLELNLTKYISFQKGCYIGQEVIARLDTYKKIQKKLVKFLIPNASDIIPEDKIIFYDENKNEIGRATSFYIKRNGIIGLGTIKTSYLEQEEFKIYAKASSWNNFAECEVKKQ